MGGSISEGIKLGVLSDTGIHVYVNNFCNKRYVMYRRLHDIRHYNSCKNHNAKKGP